MERGAGDARERNAGMVPLSPRATVDELVPYVRRLTAVLRQYERTPGKPPEGVEVTLEPASKLLLPAFPAQLRPADLRPDKVTVTGASPTTRGRAR